MKRFGITLITVAAALMLFCGGSVFAASSDNARVVSAVGQYDSGLANLTEQFLQENAAYGKTLTSAQADQIIGIVNANANAYAQAKAGTRTDALYNQLSAAYTQALAVADISGSVSRNGNGVVTIYAKDNTTGVTAGSSISLVSGVASVSNVSISAPGKTTAGSGNVNYIAATAVDHSGYVWAGLVALAAVGSFFYAASRKKSEAVA